MVEKGVEERRHRVVPDMRVVSKRRIKVIRILMGSEDVTCFLGGRQKTVDRILSGVGRVMKEAARVSRVSTVIEYWI